MPTTSHRPPDAADSRTPGSSKTPGTDNRPRVVLALVLAAQFMALLDTSAVHVAAPTIRAELGSSGAGLQLIVAGYTIAYATLLITGARLGALLGHRRVWLGGLALFTVASLACGLAEGTGWLIAFRLLQGVGAGLLIPQVLSLIQLHFTGEARVRAVGAYSAVLAGGIVAGLVVGGVLAGTDVPGAGWRPVFLVNVPIGAALLVLGARLLPRDRPGRAARPLDLPGLALLAAAVGLFAVPLVLGQERGWPLWTRICLAGAVVALVVFRAYESRLARRGGAPLIAPRLLRTPGTGAAVTRIALVMAVNAGCFFAFALHLQESLGYGPLRAGLMSLPVGLAHGAVSLTWRRLPVRRRPALATGGFVVTASALVAIGVLLRDGDAAGLPLYAALAAFGAGLAAAHGPTLVGALAGVPPEDAADAAGVLVTVTQLGQVAGVAVFGALFLDRLEAEGSGEAWWWVTVALAVASVLGALAGLLRERR
ncbi:MFS transporter [Streptomyces sp. NPDC020875]|uniref:MFS transporter n=1 Tax=Streptomyces sp. NPDC020875 TaxID=3154898 RepID=UPI0033FDEFEB